MLSASEREAGLESSLNGGESSLLQELPPGLQLISVDIAEH